VAHIPPAWRETVRTGLGLSPTDLSPDHLPHTGALRCALAFWAERLVGGRPERPDDPPVVVALTRLHARDVYRLICASGLAKWALGRDEPPRLRTRDKQRYEWFRRTWGQPEPRLRESASRDVASHGPHDRHAPARLGLVTVARLLALVEPFRARWALQHLPYSVAKRARSLAGPNSGVDPAWATAESSILRAAWDRLYSEGRLASRYGGNA
jgi:hypothetical protein